MSSFDFQINKNSLKVDVAQSRLVSSIAEIDPLKATLSEINVNRDNIMFRLNDVVGINQNINQSDIADYYEDDSKQDDFVGNFLSGLDGNFNLDTSGLNPEYRHTHSEYGDALILDIEGSNNLTGSASQAVQDFIAGLA